jgi:hypothetical protein
MYAGTTTAPFGYENEPLDLIFSSQVFSGDGTLDVFITYDTITL